MLDGTDAVSDWPLLNAMTSVASGATWVSFHHGGGVGIGFSQHAGQVVVADGTEAAARRIERVLTNDPALGVLRHADAGYDLAVQTAHEQGLRIPLIVKVPPTWEHLAPQEPGTRVAAPVHGVDLPLTALAIAEVGPPTHMKGWPILGEDVQWRQYTWGHRDRMDERYDMQRSARDERYLYIRNYMPHRDYAQDLGYMFETPTTRVWKRMFDQGKLNEAQSVFWKRKAPEELYDLGLAEHLDVGGPGDAVDEVTRHGAREAGPAHQDPHMARVAGEKHGRLAR